MFHSLARYLVLPAEVTAFEQAYVRRMNRVALIFFFAHIPVFMGVAAICGTGVWQAFALTTLTLVGPTIAWLTFQQPRNVSLAFGFTAMCLGGLLVHFGQGSMQIEMHFYFFVLIALAAVFGAYAYCAARPRSTVPRERHDDGRRVQPSRRRMRSSLTAKHADGEVMSIGSDGIGLRLNET